MMILRNFCNGCVTAAQKTRALNATTASKISLCANNQPWCDQRGARAARPSTVLNPRQKMCSLEILLQHAHDDHFSIVTRTLAPMNLRSHHGSAQSRTKTP